MHQLVHQSAPLVHACCLSWSALALWHLDGIDTGAEDVIRLIKFSSLGALSCRMHHIKPVFHITACALCGLHVKVSGQARSRVASCLHPRRFLGHRIVLSD